MKRQQVCLWIAIGCSFCALYVSYTLMLKHVTGESGASWFDMGCSDDAQAGGANCAAVLASPYSYIPPRIGGRTGGVPAALVGMVYYTTLCLWFICVGVVSPSHKRLHFLPMFTVGFGLAGSAYFLLVMFGKLDQWCTWCLVTHGLNLVIAVCALLMWPGVGRVKSGGSTPAVVGSDSPIAAVHPSPRVLVITCLIICVSIYAELNVLGLKTWRKQAELATQRISQYETYVGRIRSNGDLFVAMWGTQHEKEITRRTDDPVRHVHQGDTTPLDVVVFSDFECPSCARFALFFEKNVVPLFAGHIKTTFKHYPIDQACNDLVSRTLHKYACMAAEMAEAARAIGGNAAFWKTHDYLYRNRNALASGSLGPEQLARAIGIDAAELASRMKSPELIGRIKEDIALAGTLGVHGTPAVFVDGKTVDPLAKVEVAFWDKLADDFFERNKLARPASSKPHKTHATQGSPGRRASP